jgi:capsid protein
LPLDGAVDCRELARNDEYVRRYLCLMRINVVGTQGVGLQVKARNDGGDLDGSGNQIIEKAWKAW